MKCPQCQKEGLKSSVHPGPSMSTLMSGSCYYDEDGEFHLHDYNTTSCHMKCSNGHEWIEESGGDEPHE